MRTQTWTFSVQISSTGRSYYTVARSFYTERGRQLPELLVIEDLAPGELFREADSFADLVTQSVRRELSEEAPAPR